ncbi:primase C-terminal domain-containing protein [Salinicoccus sp. ID82-1]|uniref:primase C-terminal domain-containing protein n=1 Tax=Salinicoccus sp. ID82-1 TaxID=2820269 RepID=UPI001F15E8DF|nr:primase C-terminal domain-containing protein [Salinicoccus sp. ID82-1]MCG1010910.1 primase C-terminal domain-containing protein [Salinicoccus sp. ID82-1]
MYNLQSIYSSILKEGIAESRIKYKKMNRYGKIAVANSKNQMIYNKGYTVGSVETLMSNSNVATHFTPNVFHWLSRKNNTVSGHEERNLKQINTFVIDFDTYNIEYTDILNAGLNLDMMPTLILKTDKGFHAYFIIDQPVYISEKTNYKSLKVAKKISQNLRSEFNKEIGGVDLTCNHFGYFRCPNDYNILFYQEDIAHNFKELMDWSRRKSDDARAHLRVVVDNTFNTQQRQIEEEWYRELIQQPGIHGGAGYGRNNAIFTLCLANFQSGVSFESCFDKMDQFNSRLEIPLKNTDVSKIVKSAYSGKYKGANKEYIKLLLESWCNKKHTSRAFNHWYKHKKLRKDRKYSHAHERESDIVEYLNAHAINGVVEISQRKLAAKFGIETPALRNVLKKSKKIKVKVVGGGAVSKFYTLQTLVQHVQNLKKKSKILISELNKLFSLVPGEYVKVFERLFEMINENPRIHRIEQVRLLI